MSILDHKNRLYTLIGVALAMFLGALDQTIVSTALPRVVAELGGLERYTWVTTIYLLVSTILVPVYGKLSDIMNRKTLEIWSVATFLIGSALCGMAGEWGTLPFLGDGMDQLIVFRGIQALGGGGLFALAFIIISDLYPPRERGKVGGVFGAVFGLSSVFGPLVGGFLTDHAGGWLPPIEGWRWVFYVNIPIGLVALWFIIQKMPRLHPHDHSRKLDPVSALLMISGFLTLILGLQLDKNEYPWNSPFILSLLGSSVVLLSLWIWHTLKVSKHPILDLRLFKNKVFTFGNVATFFFGAGFISVLIFIPPYMVNVLGVTATSAGLSVMPLTAGIVVGASIGGPVASKLGKYKAILVIGSIVSLVGSLLMVTLGVETPYWAVVLFMIVAGLGYGPAQSLYSLAVQSAVPPQEIGQATSFSQFSRQIGSTIGSAVLGAVFSVAISAAFAAHLPGDSKPDHSKLTRSTHLQGEMGPNEQTLLLEKLFSLRGDDARKALDATLADPKVPSDLKERIKDGTPAMRVEKEFKSLEERLESLILAGDEPELKTFLASKETEKLPDESKIGLLKLVVQTEKDRKAGLTDLRNHMESGVAFVQGLASSQALTAIKRSFSQVREAFAEAIHEALFYGVGITFFLVIATLLLPSLPLRGRGQAAPTEGQPPAH